MQGRGIEGYRAEVELKRLFTGERLDLEISGRADGVYEKDGLTHIEEIKSTVRPWEEHPPEVNPAHAAQLGIYGWLYCLDRGIGKISLDLVCVHRRSGKERIVSTIATLPELEETYGVAVASFLSWQNCHEACRLDLLGELSSFEFPYPDFRPGQRGAAREVFRVIRDRGILFLQAPTGIGKTIAVLYAGLKALGHDHAARLFFFTAKNSGAVAAEKALTLAASRLPHLRWISITAKSKICFLLGEGSTETQEVGRPPCQRESCPYARDYFRKAKVALWEVFPHSCFTRKQVEELARKYQVCPFELSLDLSLYCHVIVADYNYGFDYGARLRRFFSNGKTEYVFLVDEAHNLVDRARSMFSGSLSQSRILEVRRASSPPEKKILSILNSALRQARKEFPSEFQEVHRRFPAGLEKPLGRVLDGFDDLMESGVALSDPAVELYWDLSRLRTVLDHYDESYRTVVSGRRRDFTLDFLCIDPSVQLQEVLQNQRASVFFSGTLTPVAYFTRLISPDMHPGFVDLPSPFPPAHCAYLLRDTLSTRWKCREKNMDRYAKAVEEAFLAVGGNQIVFSPSFAFQDALLSRLLKTVAAPVSWVFQRPKMSLQEKKEFIAAFQTRNQVRGFAVSGGSFSESIDLVGEALVGVLIFGVGLPQVNVYNDACKNYFEEKYGNGYAWAYLYPGLNRVLQAAGRVIRSEKDQGFVYLVDQRYATGEYLRLLPSHWNLKRICQPGDFVRGLPAGLVPR